MRIIQLIKNALIIWYLRVRYKMTLFKLRKEVRREGFVQVYFFVSEIAKWKAQSLYDLMELDKRFVPVICIYPMGIESGDDNHILTLLSEKESFFQNKNMRVTNIWDVKNKCIDMSLFKTKGIIFYQQPWDVPPAPTPLQVSRNWLTFYFPYYLVNNYAKTLELYKRLQRHIFRYIVPSEDIKNFYYKEVCRYAFAGEIVGLGHPCVDYLISTKRTNMGFTVIYAPHFSFPVKSVNRPFYYSTFLDNGELILNYAKKHREIKWVFKPHPRLKSELEITGVWSKAKIQDYYDEWEKLGEACYTSDYQSLFVNSDVMITDCGSFLSEYACTRNPIVRMVLPGLNILPHPALEELYSTYYCVCNNDELEDVFDMLLVKRNDPKKELRNKAIDKIEFCNNSSAERILEYISNMLKFR